MYSDVYCIALYSLQAVCHRAMRMYRPFYTILRFLSRIQHCIQPCASSLCATPAMPSTMLNHVDKSSLHPLSGLQRVTSGAADGQPDLGLTPDQAQSERNSEAEVPQWTRDDGFHTLIGWG